MNRALATGLAFSVLVALGVVAALAAVLNSGPARSFLGDTEADRVFGQGGDFTTRDCNKGGRSASSLCFVGSVGYEGGVAGDSSGNLYVADTQNSRVLEYDDPLNTDTVADRVFGQPDFTTGGFPCAAPSAASLCEPIGVEVDAAGNLYVADLGYNRVLAYASPLTTDTAADRVFGKANFNSSGCTTGADGLCFVVGVAVDANGNLYVSDGASGEGRVLEYNSPLTTDTVADRVFGQPDFTSRACNRGAATPSADSLCEPLGLDVDGAGNLYVADHGNHRMLEYDAPLITDTVADTVFGQGGSFTANTCNTAGPGSPPSATTLCRPADVATDDTGNVLVSDGVFTNNRVLEYDNPPDYRHSGGPGIRAGGQLHE
jgi:sugar lactone lactonase YvrE